jgi:hypothetical protein
MKANRILLIVSLVIFAVLFGASVLRESPVLLYIASAIPIFIVPFLPDIPTSQKLHSGKQSTEIIKRSDPSGEEAEWLVVTFQPGTIQWNRRWLIVPTEGISTNNQNYNDDYTASVTVLKYDLKTRKSRNGTISIKLSNLSQRITGLSYTVNEVNRLMIRMEDLQSIVELPVVAATAVPARSVEVQA